MSLPILTVTLFLPLAGALLIAVIPQEDVRTIRRVGVAFAVLSLVLATIVWIAVAQAGSDQMQLEHRAAWIPAFAVHYHVGVDGLSAPLLFLTGLLTTLALFYSARTVSERVKEYFLLFLLLQTGLFGVMIALDLVLFYVCWVVSLAPAFLLIGVWGGARREVAALKFFLYILVGSTAMLLAILAIYFQTGTFSIPEIAAQAAARPLFAHAPSLAVAAFWALFAAFAIQMGSFPFHTWLADAHTEAPTPVSVVLAGVALKLGAYGLIRIALPFFPDPFYRFVVEIPIVPALAVIGIVYGVLVCMAQWDLKRLIACFSVPSMGIAMLGIAAAAAGRGELVSPPALEAAAAGLNGAAMQMVAHGTAVGGLFFLAHVLHERTETGDLRALGGLRRQIPHFYALTLIIGFTALGLPLLAGFWPIFLVLRGAIFFTPLAAFIGVLGTVFSAATVLWKVVQHVFLGPLDAEKWGQMPDMMWWEKLTVWPLMLIAVAVGVYPAPLLDAFNAALTALLHGLLR